jgi:hypothetical protein
MQRYQAALEDIKGSPRARFETCLGLEHPDLAGDCALAVLQHTRPDRRAGLVELCGGLPEGLWRQECHFILAESIRREDPEEAVALCELSGSFRDDCRQHLWQHDLHGLVTRLGPHGFAMGLEEAQAQHDRWATRLGASPEHSFRFWRHYYEAGFGSMRPLDLGACEALPDLQRERCLEAGVAVFEGSLRAAAKDVAVEAALCAPGPAGVVLERITGLAPELSCRPHPRLEQAAIAFRQDQCMMLAGDDLRF